MANWTGMARTNWFRVKDDRAFEELLREFGAEYHKRPGEHYNSYALFDEGEGYLPSMRVTTDPITGDVTEDDSVELVEAVAEHLLEGEILVYTQAGNEKYRYNSGLALATNGRDWVKIDLDDIYLKAEQAFGKSPGRAEY